MAVDLDGRGGVSLGLMGGIGRQAMVMTEDFWRE